MAELPYTHATETSFHTRIAPSITGFAPENNPNFCMATFQDHQLPTDGGQRVVQAEEQHRQAHDRTHHEYVQLCDRAVQHAEQISQDMNKYTQDIHHVQSLNVPSAWGQSAG